MTGRPPRATFFPYTTLFRSGVLLGRWAEVCEMSTDVDAVMTTLQIVLKEVERQSTTGKLPTHSVNKRIGQQIGRAHVELQSLRHLVCRLLLEKKKKKKQR